MKHTMKYGELPIGPQSFISRFASTVLAPLAVTPAPSPMEPTMTNI